MTVRTQAGQSGVDWREIENAIHAWFTGATGVDVIWANQDVPQPAWPFGTLNVIAGPDKIGGEDNVRRTVDLNAPAGQEITIEHNGPRHFTVSCQVIQGPPNTHNPDCHSRHLASAAHAALSLQSTNDAFNAVGLAVVTPEAITSFDSEVGGEWTSRSVFDVIFAFTSSVTEKSGYAEDFEIEGTYDNQGTEIVDDFTI